MVARASNPDQGVSCAAAAPDVERLREAVLAFVRSFGLLAGDRTPCGKPIPISYAHALLFLLEAGRRDELPTQQRLGGALRIDKSNVARLCAKMERAGHIVRRRSPEDGRARLLALTARGRRLAEQVDGASRERFSRLLGATPAPLRASLSASLEALATAASTLDPEVPE
ncbi:MarR family winged helix-turn-helix transcriptional regulator [Sorangium sp. So ce1036]|uniref:MarR family winged helix-turn-helix transcriptional regulator n=1 Tax=Sorangium sp. So ce1036 TaxID=3133328 RepID=UPI003EFC43F9